ncbi:RNA-directed DNA polymerase, eukaryota [Tanacetum coccineum]
MYGPRFDLHSLNQPSIWCSILREVRMLKDKGFDFISHCKKRVGDGRCTLFWDDLWISDVPLRDRFPRLFALELDKEVSVADKLGALSVAGSFRRDVRDGAECQQWSDLSSLVGSVSLSSSKDSGLVTLTGRRWSFSQSGSASLDDLFLPSQPDATRWVKYIPIKVNVFAWRARRDSLPTRYNLCRRGVALDSALCPLCDSDVEDIQHVMFRCGMAQLVFRKICRWWDLDWQDLSSFSDWHVWFSSIRLSFSIKSILEGVFCVAWWRIWMFRNRLIFDKSPPRRSVIFDDIVSFSFNWCSSRCNRIFSWEFWLKNPHLISL